jgi:hypothetical protein
VFATLLLLRVKLIFFATVALVTPSSAFGGTAAEQSVATIASQPRRVFNLVGLRWQGEGAVRFSTRSTDGRWSPWRVADAEDDRPDATTSEGRASRAWRLGNPWWVGPSTAIRYRTTGDVRRLRPRFVWSAVRAVPSRALSLAGSPPILPRAAWGANERITKAPRYAGAVQFAVVHHTAGTSNYSRAEAAAIVRAIQRYHVQGNGWNDIGYNFLVDKYGQVFEGRAGGVDRAVVGAHAEGFNTGSVGIAVIGTYGGARITAAAQRALERLIAWRLDVAHVNPLSSLSWISGGNARFASGTAVPLRAVAGHRDTGPTSCPGNALYAQLPGVARATAEIGLPKLYDPRVTGRPGELVSFTARLSTLRSWTVTVSDETGTTVGTGRGEGMAVDWTWDATALPPGRYAYVIEAGADVRPATGLVGQRATTLTLTSVRATPRTFTPNGDSVADSTTIAYTLSLAANVTATLRDEFGQTLATLFSENKRAGRHTFKFSAQGIADGRYTVVIAARAPNGREVRSEVPIVIDRTLAAVKAMTVAVSPNGDRRNDELAVTFVLADAVTTKLRILRGRRTVATPFNGPLSAGPQRLTWTPNVGEGSYAAVVEAAGQWGLRAQTARFAVDLTKPRLRLLSARSMRFSASEPGTLIVTAQGRTARVPVARRGWVLVPALAGAGRFTAVLWDAAGNRSRILRYP